MEKIQNRLRRIEGQVRGLQKLLAEETPKCDEIITQFKATQSALDNAFSVLLNENLQQCIQTKDPVQMAKILKLITKQ